MPVAPVAPVARKLRRDTEPKHALAGLLPLAIHCRPVFPTWNLGGPLSLSNVEYITKSPAMSSSDGLPVAASFPMWLQVFTTGSILASAFAVLLPFFPWLKLPSEAAL